MDNDRGIPKTGIPFAVQMVREKIGALRVMPTREEIQKLLAIRMQPAGDACRADTGRSAVGRNDGIRRRRDGFDRSDHRPSRCGRARTVRAAYFLCARPCRKCCKRCKITSKFGVFRTELERVRNLPYKMTESLQFGLVILAKLWYTNSNLKGWEDKNYGKTYYWRYRFR